MNLYARFIELYPDNVYAEEARLRAANILIKLERLAEAEPLYQDLAKPGDRFRDKARQALKALGRL